MTVNIDSEQNLLQCYWQDVRKKVHTIEPQFASLIDELDPGKKFPIFIAKYRYGDVIADTKRQLLPNPNGPGTVDIADPSIPQVVTKNLQLGADTMPFGMVLDKKVECFIDFTDKQITTPNRVWKPGQIFTLGRILNHGAKRRYSPNSILIGIAGVRSTFMLPSIGCTSQHVNLQNDYRIKSTAAKSLYDHWTIFKEITESDRVDCDWQASLLFFADTWEEHLYNDPAWQKLWLYLYRLGWESAEYYRNQIYYDLTFASIQQKRNLRPNPYLSDTARYLFATAAGAVPGYRPSNDEEALPLSIIQKAFVESYGMKKYWPIVMEPDYFHYESSLPIYNSLQTIAAPSLSPGSRRIVNTLFEMQELAHIMKIFLEEFSKETGFCSDAVLNKMTNSVEFSYFHNQKDRRNIINEATNIKTYDSRFMQESMFSTGDFCSDAKFFRGCIGIRKK